MSSGPVQRWSQTEQLSEQEANAAKLDAHLFRRLLHQTLPLDAQNFRHRTLPVQLGEKSLRQ